MKKLLKRKPGWCTLRTENGKEVVGGCSAEKKQADEEKACALCVFARRDEEGRVFCRKKNRQKEEEDCCSAFELDLLKKRPAAAPAVSFDFSPEDFKL